MYDPWLAGYGIAKDSKISIWVCYALSRNGILDALKTRCGITSSLDEMLESMKMLFLGGGGIMPFSPNLSDILDQYMQFYRGVCPCSAGSRDLPLVFFFVLFSICFEWACQDF